jgi:hypothetical protein
MHAAAKTDALLALWARARARRAARTAPGAQDGLRGDPPGRAEPQDRHEARAAHREAVQVLRAGAATVRR